MELDVCTMEDIKCQQLIQTLLVLKYIDKDSLYGMRRLYTIEEFRNMNLMKKNVYYRKFNLITYKELQIAFPTAVNLTGVQFKCVQLH